MERKKMSNVTIYKLNNIKQLIDLNKDKKNFELDFQVESSDGKHFDALVVTQEMLDSETPLEYQKAEGFISGKIVADKDIYQNYFLLLKSNEPVECKVMVNVKDILPNLQQKQQENNLPPPEKKNDNFQQEKFRERKPKNQIGKKSWFTVKNLIFLGLILLGGALLWYFYFYKKTDVKSDSPTDPLPQQQILNTSDINDEINAKFDKISSEISDGLNSKLSKNLLTINDSISNKMSEIGDGISARVSDGLNSRVDNLNNRVVDNLNNLVPKLTDGFNSKFDNISSKVDGLGPRISDGINSKFDNISSKVDGLGPKISDGINSKFDSLAPKITDGINSKISELKDGITDGISSKFSDNIGEIKTQIEKIKIQSKNDIGGSRNDAVLKKIKDFKIPEL
jgi:outer membrane murein-binding lipoprotein Lpp